MAETSTTPSPISSIVPGKYTSEKLFLKIDKTEFDNHTNDIINNGQIAFVDNGSSSFIYAQGVKVGNTDIKVEDLNLSNYATKNDVTNAINALDATYAAQSGKYISAITQTNGKITSVTHASLPTVQTVSVSSSNNSVTINGTKYTLGISNGVLSLAPYKAASISSYTLSALSANIKQDGSGTFYVGTTASVSYGIDITSTSQTLTINIDNPTGNDCKLAVTDGNGSYFRQDTSYSKINGAVNISIGSAYIMKDVATQTFSSIPVTWAAAKTYSANTTGEKTFNIYLTEKDKSPINKAITQANINATVTVKAKVPVAAITSSSTAVSLKDVEYNTNISIGTLTCNWKTTSNTTPTFYVPSCLSKTPTIKDANNFDITSGFTLSTGERTICGCKTTFKVYTMNTKPTSDSKFTITL